MKKIVKGPRSSEVREFVLTSENAAGGAPPELVPSGRWLEVPDGIGLSMAALTYDQGDLAVFMFNRRDMVEPDAVRAG